MYNSSVARHERGAEAIERVPLKKRLECGVANAGQWRTFGDVVREFWNELVSLDFKTLRTLGGLPRPGFLAAAFIEGRGDRYLAPLKAYLLAAALFFLIAPRVTDFTFERQMMLDRDGGFRALVEQRIADTGVSRELFAERFAANLQRVYTLTPILSVLSLMLILRLLYRRTFPWLGPHVVFALYYVAFFFMVALLVHGLNEQFDGLDAWIMILLQYTLLVPFMYRALRKVYKEPPGLTLRKTFAVLAIGFLADIPISIASVWLSVRLT